MWPCRIRMAFWGVKFHRILPNFVIQAGDFTHGHLDEKSWGKDEEGEGCFHFFLGGFVINNYEDPSFIIDIWLKQNNDTLRFGVRGWY